MKGQSLKEKRYRLTDNRSGESFMLKTGKKGNLLVFDEEEQRNRAIKHCPNQKSVYVEDQDDFALVSPIVFINGHLTVKPQDTLTQKFLDLHPSNAKNGGGWFEEIDEEKEAKESVERGELEIDLKYAVREMSKKDEGLVHLKTVASVLEGSVDSVKNKGVEALKSIIYNRIEANPYYFTDEKGQPNIFEDDSMYRRYIVLTSIKDGIIKKSPNQRSMLWYNGKEIVKAPSGKDLIDFFTEYLTTDDGRTVMEEIQKQA